MRGHELTRTILRSKVSREHDPLLARLLAATTMRHFPDFTPELVVSVPPGPGREDREACPCSIATADRFDRST